MSNEVKKTEWVPNDPRNVRTEPTWTDPFEEETGRLREVPQFGRGENLYAGPRARLDAPYDSPRREVRLINETTREPLTDWHPEGATIVYTPMAPAKVGDSIGLEHREVP